MNDIIFPKLTNLIMFSGGIDSAYLIHLYIKKEEPIHVHHIIFKSELEDRWKIELECSRKIVEYYKKIRDFNYTESEWGLGNIERNKILLWDVDAINFISAQLVPSILSKKVRHVSGRIMEDDFSESSLKQTKFSQMIWEAATEKYRYKAVREIHHPIRHLYKKDLVSDLEFDREVLNLTWSCRIPVDGKPCGVCKSCRVFNAGLNGEIYRYSDDIYLGN